MSVEMELGGVLLNEPNTNYSYRAVVKNLIKYNTLIADTQLLREGWKRERETHCEVTSLARANKRLTERTAWFARSRVVTLIVSPRLYLFLLKKLNLPKIDLKLKLIPNRSAYLLKTFAPAGVNYKFKIMEPCLFIRTKLISSAMIIGQERVMQTKNYSIPFNKVIRKISQSPAVAPKLNLIRDIRGNCPMWLF